MKGPQFTVEFPLPDGRRLRNRSDGQITVLPVTQFDDDGLTTSHNADFLDDPRFCHAYEAGVNTGHRLGAPETLHIEWRVNVCCWAASHGGRLDGDFVECGVSTGIVSRAVVDYVDFNRLDKSFWLFDTFAGIPEAQMAEAERPLGLSKNERHYFDSYDQVVETFAGFAGVRPVKGVVPESLVEADIERVSYLHIDMNIAYPEVAASEHFWPLLVPGAVVVYDDYASLAHVPQKTALDAWAKAQGVSILSLPTGQGLLIKS